MPTYTALTTVENKDAAQALGDALEALETAPTGVGVFEMEDGSGLWEVGGYFTDKPDIVALDLLAAVHSARAFAVSEVPDIDWVAHVRRELAPVEAGRFVVYGAHDADRIDPDAIGLLIEAAMAFGTGHHGTTKGCLVAFDALVTGGAEFANIADIGCGTAVLAMGAAKLLPDAEIIAGDIDEVAVDVAVANIEANGLVGRIETFVAPGFDHPKSDARAPFDLVFANILKAPLIALAPDMSERIVPGGQVILSGILHEQSDDVIHAYAQNGFVLKNRFQFDEWTTLNLGKI